MTVKALTPAEVVAARVENFDEVVIEVVNELLLKAFSRGQAVLKQNAVVTALMERGYSREKIFSENLLDFEGAFLAAGWRVWYDRPGYNENYEAFWTFTVA